MLDSDSRLKYDTVFVIHTGFISKYVCKKMKEKKTQPFVVCNKFTFCENQAAASYNSF